MLLATEGLFPSLLHRRIRGFRTYDFLFVWDPSLWASFLLPDATDYRPWLE